MPIPISNKKEYMVHERKKEGHLQTMPITSNFKGKKIITANFQISIPL